MSCYGIYSQNLILFQHHLHQLKIIIIMCRVCDNKPVGTLYNYTVPQWESLFNGTTSQPLY